MRTAVALVAAHPETILEDIKRVLDLAGLGHLREGAPRLLLDADGGNFRPGWGATPWQLDGVLDWLGEAARDTSVLGLGAAGATTAPAASMWRDLLERRLARPADAECLRLHRPALRMLHPALDTVLPRGVRVPVGLAEHPVLLLTSPTLRPGMGAVAAAAGLRALVTAGAGPVRRAPEAEVFAEAVGAAREILPRFGVLVDGTLWGVTTGRVGRRCVGRHVLIAGTDPVAVDSVVMRLAGIEAGRVPWLRICQDRGYGNLAGADVRLAGRTDLLDLDFDLQGDTFAAGRGFTWSAGGGLLRRLTDRMARNRDQAGLSGSGWEFLYEHYRAGIGAGVAGT